MICIDGSQGEGGGQILRSALALSAALGRPFTISNIRANRPKPGLMRQHMVAVEACAAVCGACVTGNVAGSTELLFEPGKVRGGNFRFAVGTAGSTTLVLQAVLPPLLFAPEASELVIEGGTHARWAPPFEFLSRALVPLLNRMGANVTVELARYGFYPAGGGHVRVRVEPGRSATALHLESRGEIKGRRIGVVLSRLPVEIADRELERVRSRLGWDGDRSCVTAVKDAASPGNSLALEVTCENVTEVFCAIGEQGKRSEAVADEAVDQVREYLASDAPVGRYLADQLMVPMAVAAACGGGAYSFRTLPYSPHARTNAEIVNRFIDGASSTDADGGVRWCVQASGRSKPR